MKKTIVTLSLVALCTLAHAKDDTTDLKRELRLRQGAVELTQQAMGSGVFASFFSYGIYTIVKAVLPNHQASEYVASVAGVGITAAITAMAQEEDTTQTTPQKIASHSTATLVNAATTLGFIMAQNYANHKDQSQNGI